jgi:hypothetical protein
MHAGQHTSAGTRNPPSSNSVLIPVNGQVSENRSPPLSLVKMTIVSCARPVASSACNTRPICRSIACTMRA